MAFVSGEALLLELGGSGAVEGLSMSVAGGWFRMPRDCCGACWCLARLKTRSLRAAVKVVGEVWSSEVRERQILGGRWLGGSCRRLRQGWTILKGWSHSLRGPWYRQLCAGYFSERQEAEEDVALWIVTRIRFATRSGM